MRGVRLLAAALVAADGLQGRQTPRRASCRVRAGAGFGAPKKAGTTKARRKRPRPPPRAARYAETGFAIRASRDHELHALAFPPDPKRPLIG